MRNIFLGSMALSLLVFFHFVFITVRGTTLAGMVRVSFPAMFLWSLMMTGYAFYSLWRLAEERRQLLHERLATDSKTGTRSLEYMKSLLRKECERSEQAGQPLSVLYVDLKNLDLVNHRFGHTVGDIVLKEAAKIVQGRVGLDGVVGRVGGDEFVVVLPGVDAQKARELSDEIGHGVRGYRLDLLKKGQVDFLECSIGIVARPTEGATPEEIISAALKATGEPKPETRTMGARL